MKFEIGDRVRVKTRRAAGPNQKKLIGTVRRLIGTKVSVQWDDYGNGYYDWYENNLDLITNGLRMIKERHNL